MTVNVGAGPRPWGLDDPAQKSQVQEGWEGAHSLGTVSSIDPSQKLALMISGRTRSRTSAYINASFLDSTPLMLPPDMTSRVDRIPSSQNGLF